MYHSMTVFLRLCHGIDRDTCKQSQERRISDVLTLKKNALRLRFTALRVTYYRRGRIKLRQYLILKSTQKSLPCRTNSLHLLTLMRDHASDKKLIEQFLRGDTESVSRVRTWIRGTLAGVSPADSQMAEDIIGDTILKLLLNFRSDAFHFDSSLKTYVQSVARYTMIDTMRRYRVKSAHILRDNNVNPIDPANLHDRTAQSDFLQRLISLIGPACRELWQMIFYEGKRYEEIAKELSISEATVKTRAFRCKEKARELKRKLV